MSLPGQVFLHIYPSYLDSSKFLAPIGFATFMYLRSSVIFKCLLSPKSATTQCRIASTSPGVPVSNRMSSCCVPAAVHQRDQRLDELGVVGCVVGAEKPRDPLLTIEAAHHCQQCHPQMPHPSLFSTVHYRKRRSHTKWKISLVIIELPVARSTDHILIVPPLVTPVV